MALVVDIDALTYTIFAWSVIIRDLAVAAATVPTGWAAKAAFY